MVERCPKCGGECYRDEVDVGVGTVFGPWGCPDCAWSEDPKYDFSDGRSKIQGDGSALDQYGGLHPAASPIAAAMSFAKEGSS